MNNIQVNKKVLLFFSLILFVNSIGIVALLFKYSELKYSIKRTEKETTNLIPEDDLIRKEIASLKNSLNSDKTKLIELDFFSRNKKKYELNNGKYSFAYCCTGDDKTNLYYDFSIHRSDGSTDDFGTSSYLNFLSHDTIESINTEVVGLVNYKDPILKIIIKTQDRYTEGIVYPESYYEGTPQYSRLYEINGDYLDYRASVSLIDGGYQVIVKVGPQKNVQEQKKYLLLIDGQKTEIKKE